MRSLFNQSKAMVLCLVAATVVLACLSSATPAAALSFILTPQSGKRCFAYEFSGSMPSVYIRFRAEPSSSHDRLRGGVRVTAHRPVTHGSSAVDSSSSTEYKTEIVRGEELGPGVSREISFPPYSTEAEKYFDGTYLCCFATHSDSTGGNEQTVSIIIEEVTAKSKALRDEEAQQKARIIALRGDLLTEHGESAAAEITERIRMLEELTSAANIAAEGTSYLGRRDGRMRMTSESTFTRIILSIGITIFGVIASGWITYVYTKRLLVKKKLV